MRSNEWRRVGGMWKHTTILSALSALIPGVDAINLQLNLVRVALLLFGEVLSFKSAEHSGAQFTQECNKAEQLCMARSVTLGRPKKVGKFEIVTGLDFLPFGYGSYFRGIRTFGGNQRHSYACNLILHYVNSAQPILNFSNE